MVFFNHATRQMTAKIVYYGPGLCGKTTNLNTIYGKTSTKARGEMVSLNTETDRTLFFDLLPMDVGMVGGFKTKLQLYTVPGQVFYNSTRKLVLKGVDGIVFVVDSQVPMLDASKESLQNLEENLKELGLKLGDIPTVFQWNKRDLKNIVPVEQLEKDLNPRGLPSFQSCAQDGTGVFETLRGITKLSLSHIKTHVLGETTAPPPTAPAKDASIKIVVPDPVSAPPPPAPYASRPSSPGPTPATALSTHDLPSISKLLDEDTAFNLVPPPDPLATQPVASLRGVPLPDEDVADLPASLESGPPMATPTAAIPTQPSLPREAEQVNQVAQVPPVQAPTPQGPRPQVPPPQVPPPTRPLTEVKKPTFQLGPLKAPPGPTLKAHNPKDAINSLLGELTMVGKLGTPSVVKVDLPADLDSSEVEVLVTVKQKGQIVGEGSLKRPAPVKGVAARLTIELRRP